MLSRIHIRDLAVVSSLELELGTGMTALTGETGAGKSILVDALGLALGERADNAMIRAGSDRAEVTAVFDISQIPRAGQWLQEQELEAGDECILRRLLVSQGSSRAYINGTPVPVRSLQTLGDLLVDIHGQHAHQSLMHRTHQRDLLDQYAGLMEPRRQIADCHRRWQASAGELEEIRQSARERIERLDLLRYQSGELEALALAADELGQLDLEQRRLSNAGRLIQGCGEILEALYDGDGSVDSLLTGFVSELDDLMRLDPALGECRELLEGAAIQAQEAASALRHHAETLETDPDRLEAVESRLGEIHSLARKYRCRPEELPLKLEEMKAEQHRLENADQLLGELEARVSALEGEYESLARQLDKARRKAATALSKAVSSGIRTLGMPNGQLEIAVESLPDDKAGASGRNRIELLVTTNPGQPPQPLNKVASGGELSRISLAIQVATLNCAQVPTLIFDEVDVGIGGGVAEIVGRLLREVGGQKQVLCVTHLPQVAALGHHHLQVEKRTSDGRSATVIRDLDEAKRVEEIARMLGGLEITERTLEHAREMISLSAR